MPNLVVADQEVACLFSGHFFRLQNSGVRMPFTCARALRHALSTCASENGEVVFTLSGRVLLHGLGLTPGTVGFATMHRLLDCTMPVGTGLTRHSR